MKSEARKHLQEVITSWKDFDAAMKVYSGGQQIASEEQARLRLTNVSERFQKAMREAEAYLDRRN